MIACSAETHRLNSGRQVSSRKSSAFSATKSICASLIHAGRNASSAASRRRTSLSRRDATESAEAEAAVAAETDGALAPRRSFRRPRRSFAAARRASSSSLFFTAENLDVPCSGARSGARSGAEDIGVGLSAAEKAELPFFELPVRAAAVVFRRGFFTVRLGPAVVQGS
jgi:hypothetical protein